MDTSVDATSKHLASTSKSTARPQTREIYLALPRRERLPRPVRSGNTVFHLFDPIRALPRISDRS